MLNVLIKDFNKYSNIWYFSPYSFQMKSSTTKPLYVYQRRVICVVKRFNSWSIDFCWSTFPGICAWRVRPSTNTIQDYPYFLSKTLYMQLWKRVRVMSERAVRLFNLIRVCASHYRQTVAPSCACEYEWMLLRMQRMYACMILCWPY